MIPTLKIIAHVSDRAVGETAPAAAYRAIKQGPGQTDSIPKAFLESTEQHASRSAVIDGTRAIDHQTLQQLASAVAEKLVSLNRFSPGSHVGLLFDNSIEYVACFYGVLLAGGVVVPISMQATPSQQQRALRQANTAVLLSAGEPAFEAGNRVDFKLEYASSTSTPVALSSDVDPDSLAMILFTSGSSGDAKGVMLSHRNILANANSICSVMQITHNDRSLAAMPFPHALGNSVLQSHLLSGGSLVMSGNLSFPAAMLESLERNECTNLVAVPEFLNNLLKVWSDDVQLPPSLRLVGVAGGRLDSARALSLAERISPAQLYLMYGQTEATARLAWLPPSMLEKHSMSMGIAMPGVETSIRDADGVPTGPGEVGTLYVRGANVMLGYWNDPNGTSKVLKDGWLNTGDLVCQTTDGLLEHKGRGNRLVKIRGHRFHPNEVESCIERDLPVARAIAVPFETALEPQLGLCIELGDDSTLSEADIRVFCRQHLPTHMLPSRIMLLDKLPTNGAHKTDFAALRSLLEETTASRQSA